jgi:hypothetical protein
MITINNKRFAKDKKEHLATLFEPGGTADGFYKVRKHHILFTDLQGEPFAAMINNRHNEQFFVNAGLHDGKLFFQHGTNERVAARLGIPDSLTAQDVIAKRIKKEVYPC